MLLYSAGCLPFVFLPRYQHRAEGCGVRGTARDTTEAAEFTRGTFLPFLLRWTGFLLRQSRGWWKAGRKWCESQGQPSPKEMERPLRKAGQGGKWGRPGWGFPHSLGPGALRGRLPGGNLPSNRDHEQKEEMKSEKTVAFGLPPHLTART